MPRGVMVCCWKNLKLVSRVDCFQVANCEAIITALEAAALNPEVPKFSVGVLQT
jgi:hypothetical protein